MGLTLLVRFSAGVVVRKMKEMNKCVSRVIAHLRDPRPPLNPKGN